MIDGLPRVLYGLLKVKKIVDVTLFPGMVTVGEGVIMRLPVLSLPVQNMSPRMAYSKTKELPLGAPNGFQATWTSETMIGSCGLVIVILMRLPSMMIEPVVMLPHPGTGVEVEVGVNVAVGVNVMVGV